MKTYTTQHRETRRRQIVRCPILIIRRCVFFALLIPDLFIVVGNVVVDKFVRVIEPVVYERILIRRRNVGVRRRLAADHVLIERRVEGRHWQRLSDFKRRVGRLNIGRWRLRDFRRRTCRLAARAHGRVATVKHERAVNF